MLYYLYLFLYEFSYKPDKNKIMAHLNYHIP